MSNSRYIQSWQDLEIKGVDTFTTNLNGSGLGDWEQSDPCRYTDQSCKGKLFGGLKKCRRRREKSQALCDTHKKQLEEKARWEAQREDMMQALQSNVTTTAKQQQTANFAMKTGLAIGGITLAGAAIVFALKRKKKSTTPKKKNQL